jgi:TRAP transporter TAXI family solute receptor
MMDKLGYKPSAIRFGSGSDMSGQLQDGLLDAFLFASGVPIPAFSEAETQGEVNFLDFTADEVAKLTTAYPELSAGTLPASTYRTAGRELRVVGMFNFAIGHKSLPEDLAYEITKAVLGQNDRLRQAIAAGSETLASNAGKNTFLPYHPGAARYLREAGQTIPDNLVRA